MDKIAMKFRKGVASFYIVAFATLIMVIIAASFAAVVVSEIARTSNDDLSQSAYDAALAGVEDAKLAYMNYQTCLKKTVDEDSIKEPNGDDTLTCGEIIWLVQHPDCDMVARILGRVGETDPGGEVIISETSSSSTKNNLNQAYTCVKIETTLKDYRASLSSSNPYKVIKVALDDDEMASMGDIQYVRLSWYSNREGKVYNYNNLVDGRVTFQPLKASKAAAPPTMALEIMQTADGFTMSQLNSQTNDSGETDRATVYLVPSNKSTVAGHENTVSRASTYIGAYYDGAGNKITAAQVASTNNLMKNLPYAVYCPEKSSNEFACSVSIELPKPIGSVGGNRNSDTFVLVASLPYGQPDTDFAVEFCTKEGSCIADVESDAATVDDSGIVSLGRMQTMIDSTGRANDLYRRVEVRMETTDVSFPYPLYAIEATNYGSSSAEIKKDLTVSEENSVYTDLPSFDAAIAGSHDVKIYPKIDGDDYVNGRGGFRFDVQMNGVTVASDVMTWNGRVPDGVNVGVIQRNVEGYRAGSNIVEAITEDKILMPTWTAATFSVKVITNVGGVNYDEYEGFSYDVYMNDDMVGRNIESFDRGEVKYGTKVKVVPSYKNSGCNGQEINATVTSNMNLVVYWTGACLIELEVAGEVDDISAASGDFTFSVYLDNNPTPIANNVTYFKQNVAAGTMARVELNPMTGYSMAQDIIAVGSIDSSTVLHPQWYINYYPVDVNPIIDGISYPEGMAGFRFKVELDGNEVTYSDGGSAGYYYNGIDYYNENVKYGTFVKVIPEAAGGDYVQPNALEGTVGVEGLILEPVWHKGFYTVDVNEVVNSTTYAGGVYGLTFDVFVNDILLADDVIDFYRVNEIAWGSTIRVVANVAGGFDLINGDITKVVLGFTEFNPTWIGQGTFDMAYNVSVNPIINGQPYPCGYSGFNFDVYINNVLTKNDVDNFCWPVASGTSVRIFAEDKTNYALTNKDVAKTVDGDAVFEPTWRQGITTVAYDANGGSGTIESQVIRTGDSVILNSGDGFSRSGYTFDGWKDGSGTSYAAGASFTATSLNDVTVTMRAQWREIPKVKITYNGNGSNSGSMPVQNVTRDYTTTLYSNEYNRSDYKFTGWNTARNGSGTGYSDGQTVSFSTDVTLYAQWRFDGIYIQDFTNAQCQSLASSSDVELYDRRDMERYTVRYLNGQCWMTSNLRIFTSTAAGQPAGTITSTDSNFSNRSTWKIDATSGSSYVEAVGSAGSYNYCAVTVGNSNGCTADGWSYGGGDICPANWRLPSSADEVYYAFYNKPDLISGLSGTYWITQTMGNWEFGGTPDNSKLQCGFYKSNNALTFAGDRSRNCGGDPWYGFVRSMLGSVRCVHK